MGPKPNKIDSKQSKKKNTGVPSENPKSAKDKPLAVFSGDCPPNQAIEIKVDEATLKQHRIVSESLWGCFEKALCKSFLEPRADGFLIWRIFQKLFEEAWLEHEKIDDGPIDAKYRADLLKNLMKLLLQNK